MLKISLSWVCLVLALWWGVRCSARHDLSKDEAGINNIWDAGREIYLHDDMSKDVQMEAWNPKIKKLK